MVVDYQSYAAVSERFNQVQIRVLISLADYRAIRFSLRFDGISMAGYVH